MCMTQLQALLLLHGIRRKLGDSAQQLDLLLIKEKNKMIDPTITAVIADIDAATNAIAARIQKLIDDATSAGSVSAAEVVAALGPEVAKLRALGADPGVPVPPTPQP